MVIIRPLFGRVMGLSRPLAAILALSAASTARASASSSSSCPAPVAHPGDLLRFPGLAGGPSISADTLRDRVVLVVNTASYCGFTPQLASLAQLHARFSPRGFTVVGVPSNDFGAQEPDAEPVIRAFYDAKGVNFPLTKKTSVVGGEAHPFFLHLQRELGDSGAPSWNFGKWLLDAKGDIVGLFPPSMDPLDPEVVKAVEEAIMAKPQPKEEL